MKISNNEIAFRKKVGKSGAADVFHIKTIGGLHLMVKNKTSGGSEVLGSGPHRAVARHLADQYDSGVSWTELSKGEHYDIADFQHILPKYQELTEQLRKAQGL
jgi:hypothetical protein